MVAALAISLQTVAATQIRSNHDDYFPGEEIQIAFQGGPGNPKDWIGVYPPEAEPGPVGSTIWKYVDDTQGGATGLTEGSVTFPNGLSLGGDWVAYFLLNAGYTKAATNMFRVVDPSSTVVRVSKRTFNVGEPIQVAFTNGTASAKDWVGIYQVGQTPGGGTPSPVWAYVDGTQAGNSDLAEGVVTFATGLNAPGEWVAHFLYNGGYDILASETFTVVAASVATPRILSVSPANGVTNLPPIPQFAASITNGTTKVAPASIRLTLNGAAVTPVVTTEGELVRVAYTGTGLVPAGSEQAFVLSFQDNAVPPNDFSAETRGTVAPYSNIVLSNPVVFENFDAVPEGSLPAGWTEKAYSSPINEEIDFGDLGSAAYRTWTAVDADRFTGTFVTYGNPDSAGNTDYQRMLTQNPANIVNGAVYPGPFAKGRFLFGNSGYQNGGASQVLFLFTPDFNLTGKTNIHLGFNSLWEQNQDSIATIEYSIDSGASWLPIAYFLDGNDVQTVADPVTGEQVIDAEATLLAEHGDVARYTDEDGNEIGGTYGAFVAAPISAALAPFIQSRVNDNPSESKRVEWYRLTDADNQAKVRFRFGHAGTDSWYFGIDDFGLYAPEADRGPAPTVVVTRGASDITISWPAGSSGYVLESRASLTAGSWEPVPGVTGNSHTVQTSGGGGYYRLRK